MFGALSALFQRPKSNVDTFKNFEALDFVRAFSHLTIVLLHVHHFAQGLFQNYESPFWANLMTNASAVDALFMVSAILATSEILHKGKTFSLRNFYVNRILRLVPCLYIVLGLVLLVKQTNRVFVLADMFFMSDYVPQKYAFYSLIWSVACDVKYHLIVPFIVPLLKKLTPRQRILFALGCASLSILNRTSSLVRNVTAEDFANYNTRGVDLVDPRAADLLGERMRVGDFYYFAFHFRIMPFIYGTVIALNHYEKQDQIQASVVNVVASICLYMAGHFSDTNYFLTNYYRAVYLHGVSYDIYVFAIFMMISMLLSMASIPSIFGWRIWSAVSRLTYPSYLLHLLVISGVIVSIKEAKPTYPLTFGVEMWIFAITVAITMPLSFLCFCCVEKPTTDLRHKWLIKEEKN